MTVELGTYGFVISYLYRRYLLALWPTLLTGMFLGRLAAGFTNYILLTQFAGMAFSLKVFLIAAFITAIPGILVQLVMIPIMIRLLENANIIDRVGVNEIRP